MESLVLPIVTDESFRYHLATPPSKKAASGPWPGTGHGQVFATSQSDLHLPKLRRLAADGDTGVTIMAILVIGCILTTASCIVAWGRFGILTEFSFFPLWLGYILTVNGLIEIVTGTSLLNERAPLLRREQGCALRETILPLARTR
jgi:hypothetical protein